MILKKVSTDKSGIATLLIVVIVVVILGVAAVGAFVVLSGNDGNNGKDGSDGNDGPGDEPAVQGKLGIGSKLYFDVGTTTSKSIAAATPTSIICEVIGEDGTFYFISVPDVMNAFAGEPYTLKMNKTTGALDWATANGTGKWTAIINISYNPESNASVTIEVTIGENTLGTVITSMKITAAGKTSINAALNVAKSTVVAPANYVPPGDVGKYIEYRLIMDMTMTAGTMTVTADYTANLKVSVVGLGAAGKYLVVTELDGSFTMAGTGTSLDKTSTVKVRDVTVSDSTNVLPDEYAFDLDGMTFVGNKTFTFGSKTVNVKEYKEIIGGETLTVQIGADKPLLYKMTLSMNEVTPGSSTVMTMEIKCTATNF